MTATTEIKVLSVRQPHAHWILNRHPVLGFKVLENRSWRSNYTGRMFIHASRWDPLPVPQPDTRPDPIVESMWKLAEGKAGPIGHILGCVDVVFSADQHDMDEAYYVMAGQSSRKLTERQQELCQYLPEPDSEAWEWYTGDAVLILASPRVLEVPIGPVAGRLNIWKYRVESDQIVFREVRTKRRRRKRKPGRLDDPGDE